MDEVGGRCGWQEEIGGPGGAVEVFVVDLALKLLEGLPGPDYPNPPVSILDC